MTAETLLAEVRRRGVRLEPRGERLHVTPKSALTPELIEELRAHKPELLTMLADPCPACGGGPAVLLCRRCGIGAVAADAFLASVPEAVRREPPSSGGPPIYHRPGWESRCQRCKDLFAAGVTVLACGTCDLRVEPDGRRSGPWSAA